MADEQTQESSGVKSDYFAGYGSDTQHVVNLQVSVTRAQSYIDAATLADNKTQVMYSAIGQVTDLITSLRSQLSAATTGSSTATASVIASAQQMLTEMGSLMKYAIRQSISVRRRPHGERTGRPVALFLRHRIDDDSRHQLLQGRRRDRLGQGRRRPDRELWHHGR